MSTDPSHYTLETITAAMETYGFSGPQRNRDEWVFWRYLDSPNVCLCNDRVQLTVTVSEFVNGGHTHRLMTIGITGEYRPETWAKLEVYAIPWDQGMEEMYQIQDELLRAWSAMYGGKK